MTALTPKDRIALLQNMQTNEGYGLFMEAMRKFEQTEIEALINEDDPAEVIKRQQRVRTTRAIMRMPDGMIDKESRKSE